MSGPKGLRPRGLPPGGSRSTVCPIRFSRQHTRIQTARAQLSGSDIMDEALELHPDLRFDAGAERVFDQLHFGDQIGGLDQRFLGVSSG